MSKCRKVISLAMVGSIALSMAACTSPASSSSAPSSYSATQTPATPMEISYVSLYCGEIVEDNWAEEYIQEKLGIELTTKKVDISQAQQRDLMLASGEMPDCAWIIKNPETPKELYSQGITRTIPWDMIEKHAPNYAALLNSDLVGKSLNKDSASGEYMALTGYTAGNSNSATHLTSYRYDWLQNVGIEPNGEIIPLGDDGRLFLATEPFTKAQFTEIMKSFTEKDPDKNGKNDTFGLSASQRSIFSWMGMYGMFGFGVDGTVEVDGVAENYYVTPQYKAFLKYFAEMYKNGYVDTEFATLDFNQSQEKISGSKAGIAGISAKWIGPGVSYAQTRAPNVAINQNPDAKVVVVPTEVNDDKSGGAQAYTPTNYNYAFYVNKNVSDEKLAKILEMFDFMNFDDEAKIALRYGEEGVHFSYTDEANKRGPVLNEGYANGGKDGLLVYNTNYIETLDIVSLKQDAVQAKVAEYTFGKFANNLYRPYRIDLFGDTKYGELVSTYGATINTLVDEFFYNAIGGNIDIDAEWDKYIENLNKSGYAEMREELQKAPLYSELAK